MSAKPLVIITTGDPDGIGLEVSAKALKKIKNPRATDFILFISKTCPQKHFRSVLQQLGKKFRHAVYASFEAALGGSEALRIVLTDVSPAHWVEMSARACLENRAQAMATAPLSKPLIKAAGFSDVGHTEILKRVCKAPRAYMAFLGKSFNVILATGHVPVAGSEALLTLDCLRHVALAAAELRPLLPATRRRKPLGVLALNPHAGDDGIIGDFEKRLLPSFFDFCKNEKIQALGPLVPDAAFQRQHWAKYSFYVAAYHDQGLIPFKLVHGFNGVHVTLGLPIWRTSVDHGTAKDIFGKNIANSNSMLEAINLAALLARKKKEPLHV